MGQAKVTFIDETDITGKRVLLRADFDVSLNPDFSIADDFRIKQNIPTIRYLLQNKNRLICVAKLDRPKKRDPKLSLNVVVERLQNYLPECNITFVEDFLTVDRKVFQNQTENEIILLENIRFYPEEQANDLEFAKKISVLADCYVNDAFSVSHRTDTSVVAVPKLLPSYGGLLMKKELEMIAKVTESPARPLVAIIGGTKVETKFKFIERLKSLADVILIGSGMMNSIAATDKIFLPLDVITDSGDIKKISELESKDRALDIGPETEAKYGSLIAKAQTIIWNGPVGNIEKETYRRGTEFIYYSIAHNDHAVSLVGGGDTIAAISKEEYLEKITHISTGGGAMLEYIENGTLPGIEALKRLLSSST